MLNSEDANRTVVQNLGRAIVKKTTIKISGNEVMSLDDSDVYHCYNDLWKAEQEGRIPSNRNTTRIRVSAGKRMHLLQKTRPLPIFIAIDSTSHWISICSRATCRSIRARSMLPLTTPLTTSKTVTWSTTWWRSQSWPAWLATSIPHASQSCTIASSAMQNQQRQERHHLKYQPQPTRPQHEGYTEALWGWCHATTLCSWHWAFYNPKITKAEITI